MYEQKQKDLADRRFASRVESAEAMLEFSKERVHGVRVNGAALDNELDKYLRWFKQLEGQQACPNKDPLACPSEQFANFTSRIEKREANQRQIEAICGKRIF